MSYQPNVVSKGDVVEINGALFECKNDFNKLRDNKLKLVYIGEVVAKQYHKGIIRKGEI
jgi:hypothetical protein